MSIVVRHIFAHSEWDTPEGFFELIGEILSFLKSAAEDKVRTKLFFLQLSWNIIDINFYKNNWQK